MLVPEGFDLLPKSSKPRIVPMSDMAYRALEMWNKRKPLRTGELVFKMGVDKFKRGFRKLRKKVGIKIRIHDFRHFFCQQLLMAGVPLKTLADLLGHSTTMMVEKIYGHIAQTHRKAEINKIDKLWQSVHNATIIRPTYTNTTQRKN